MKEIPVKTGEIKVGTSGDNFKATLGSCIGIAFVWRRKEICALAHCLLPEETEESSGIGAKTVKQAILSCISLLNIETANIFEIEVFVAGGGNMTPHIPLADANHIGLQNIAAAEKYLNIYGFKFRFLDVGGIHARQMYLDCKTGAVAVSRLELS